MAPICRPRSRVEAIGKIRDMIRLNAPRQEITEAAGNLRGVIFYSEKLKLEFYEHTLRQRSVFTLDYHAELRSIC